MKRIRERLGFEKGPSYFVVVGFDPKTDTVRAKNFCSKQRPDVNFPLAETGLNRNFLMSLTK